MLIIRPGVIVIGIRASSSFNCRVELHRGDRVRQEVRHENDKQLSKLKVFSLVVQERRKSFQMITNKSSVVASNFEGLQLIKTLLIRQNLIKPAAVAVWQLCSFFLMRALLTFGPSLLWQVIGFPSVMFSFWSSQDAFQHSRLCRKPVLLFRISRPENSLVRGPFRGE